MKKQTIQNQSDVLDVLKGHDKPLSAYDVLARLRELRPKLAPPTVYRSLAALEKRGEVHRLESINAYVACQCDHHGEASVMRICDDCSTVEETVAPDLLDDLTALASQSGFSTRKMVIELYGTCAQCGAEGAETAPL